MCVRLRVNGLDSPTNAVWTFVVVHIKCGCLREDWIEFHMTLPTTDTLESIRGKSLQQLQAFLLPIIPENHRLAVVLTDPLAVIPYLGLSPCGPDKYYD